jgi:hypothetical protein
VYAIRKKALAFNLRSLQPDELAPETAKIRSQHRPLFDHHLIAHFLQPGIKLFDMDAQQFTQFAWIASQHDMIMMIDNAAEPGSLPVPR